MTPGTRVGCSREGRFSRVVHSCPKDGGSPVYKERGKIDSRLYRELIKTLTQQPMSKRDITMSGTESVGGRGPVCRERDVRLQDDDPRLTVSEIVKIVGR